MRKYIVILIFLLVIGIILFLSRNRFVLPGDGGLQVTTNIKASVYLNDKLVGTTPFCKCTPEDTIKEGEYLLNLVPEDRNFLPFSFKVKVNKGVLTAVERTFLPGSLASTAVLSLEKIASEKPQLLITSIPDEAMVLIDSNPSGTTPFLTDNISASEHEVELQKEGFGKKTLKIRVRPFYKLVAYIILGTKSEDEFESLPTISPESTPSATPSFSIRIKDTPTGFLRIREGPDLSENEIERVKPGDIFPFLEEQNEWFKIKLNDGKTGWVSTAFSEKIPSP